MRAPDRRDSDEKFASGEVLPVLLLLELEPALTFRADDGYRLGEAEADRLMADADLDRGWSLEPFRARDGSKDAESEEEEEECWSAPPRSATLQDRSEDCKGAKPRMGLVRSFVSIEWLRLWW